MNLLSGKKTYITAGVGTLCWFAVQMGWMTSDQFDNALKGLGVLTAIFLREAVQKSGPAQATPPEIGAKMPGQCSCTPETGVDYNVPPPKIG